MHLYQHKRTVDGRTVRSKIWRGRYRLAEDAKLTDVGLETTDKEVAASKLRRLVSEAEKEREGLIAPKAMREAANHSFAHYITEYLAERRALGRDEKYVLGLQRQLELLVAQCGWKRVVDVTAESFSNWRTRQKKSAKTLNEYLTAAHSLVQWMQKRGKLAHDPLASVEKVSGHKDKKLVRRALTENEVTRLVAASGARGVLYLCAAKTGLRRGELRKLEWSDVALDGQEPHIRIRASISKSRKAVRQPLDAELAGELVALRKTGSGSGRVFAGLLGRMGQMRADLKAAEIPFVDADGRRADFHALRLTFQMLLTLSQASPRVSMELMRHSDIKLTMGTYTDSTQLPLRNAINALPSMLPKRSIPDTHQSTQTFDAARHSVSRDDAEAKNGDGAESRTGKGFCHDTSRIDAVCLEGELVRGAGFEPATFRV
jgi:integrase